MPADVCVARQLRWNRIFGCRFNSGHRCPQTHVLPDKHAHAPTHTRTQACTHTRKHAHKHTCAHAHVRADAQTHGHIHTSAHTQMHTGGKPFPSSMRSCFSGPSTRVQLFFLPCVTQCRKKVCVKVVKPRGVQHEKCSKRGCVVKTQGQAENHHKCSPCVACEFRTHCVH